MNIVGNREPEENPIKDNPYSGIREVSLGQRTMERLIQTAAIITVIEFLIRIFSG